MVHRERFIPYLFLLPAIGLIAVFNLFPTIATLTESFHTTSIMTGNRIFVGLENFQLVFNDPVFWKSLEVTLVFSLLVNPLQVALALGLALLANQRVAGITFFRTIYLIPVAVSINVTTIVWGLMLNTDSGIINGFLTMVGLPKQPFLTSPTHALWSVILLATWKGVPLWALFFLAGLQGIPDSVIEAAKIDGANRWQIFRYVTVPLLRGIMIFVLVADTVANFLLFTPILLLTQGGPQLSTNLIMYETYRRGFVYNDLGRSAAMLSVMLMFVLAVIAVEFGLLRRRDT
jgi:multiple sugar transport system permease protein